MIKRIISGGQIGADIAGLRAAKKLGLETGGWAPKGYKTLKGNNLELRDIYGLDEHESPNYPPRTYNNVSDADATIRIAANFWSYGEQATLKAINEFNKPYRDIKIKSHDDIPYIDEDINEFREWTFQFEVLNVAGTANQALEAMIEEFLVKALSDVAV